MQAIPACLPPHHHRNRSPQPAATTRTLSPPQPWLLQPPPPQLSPPQPPPPPQSLQPNRHCLNHHPDPVTAAAPTAPLPPVSPGPHLQHHPSYTSTSSMYLFKYQIYHYFLCMNVTNLV